MEDGIAIATKPELARPRKKRSTPTIRISPETMLFSRLDTIIAMSSELSEVNSTFVVGGNSGIMVATTSRTSWDVAMMF